MRTTTYLFIALIIVLNAAPTSAKIWIVDNTGGNPLADYTTISEAQTNAQDGDTLYVYGSPTTYGGVTISKQLYIFGTGYFLDENPDTQARPVSSKISYIIFSPGSEGSVFEGFEVTATASNRSVYIQTDTIYIRRNHIYESNLGTAIDVNPGVAKVVVTQNYIERPSGSYDAIRFRGRDGIISNNYIYHFYESNFAINFAETNASALVENNVIHGAVTMQQNCTFRNNILISGIFTPTGCTYTNNIGNADQFGEESGNKMNIEMSTVFVDSASHTTDGRWQLVTGSPAIGAGFDGIDDCGMFGGAFPYVLSGLPSIPTIYYFEAPLRGAQNQGLDVTIKVKSVN